MYNCSRDKVGLYANSVVLKPICLPVLTNDTLLLRCLSTIYNYRGNKGTDVRTMPYFPLRRNDMRRCTPIATSRCMAMTSIATVDVPAPASWFVVILPRTLQVPSAQANTQML